MLQDRRTPLLLALISLLTAYLLWSAGWLRGLDAALLSLSFRARGPEAAAPEVVVIGMDALSVQGTAEWGASMPDVYAGLLEKLREADARVIALDVPVTTLYPGGDERSRSSDRLAEAIKDCGNVVLPCVLEPANIIEGRGASSPPDEFAAGNGELEVPRELRKGYLVGPPAALSRAAAGVGHLNLYPDVDGAVRAIPLLTPARGKLWPSLALEAARVYRGLPPGAASLTGQVVALGDTATQTSAGGEMLINFSGGYDHYPRLWLHEVMQADAQTARSKLSGKIVLVGPISHAPYWRTPVHPVMPGVELNANAVGNLLHAHELRPVSRMALLLYALIVALIMGLFVYGSRAVRGVIICLELFVASLLIMPRSFRSRAAPTNHRIARV